jgi:hypothetical protein
VRAEALYDGRLGFVSLNAGAKRGSCNALAVNQNTASPVADSSLGGPAIPCMHHNQTASQQSPRLTANLLDPLVALHCSLSPPPRYCTQLHPTRHNSKLATFRQLFFPLHISP